MCKNAHTSLAALTATPPSSLGIPLTVISSVCETGHPADPSIRCLLPCTCRLHARGWRPDPAQWLGPCCNHRASHTGGQYQGRWAGPSSLHVLLDCTTFNAIQQHDYMIASAAWQQGLGVLVGWVHVGCLHSVQSTCTSCLLTHLLDLLKPASCCPWPTPVCLPGCPCRPCKAWPGASAPHRPTACDGTGWWDADGWPGERLQ